MKRITCSPTYHAENCGDFCGLLPRCDHRMIGFHECLENSEKCDDCIIFQAFERLKAYEDTGYSPEEVLELAKKEGIVDG